MRPSSTHLAADMGRPPGAHGSIAGEATTVVRHGNVVDAPEPSLDARRVDLGALKEAVRCRRALGKDTPEWHHALDAERVLVARIRRWVGHRDPVQQRPPERTADEIVSDWVDARRALQRVPVGSLRAAALQAQVAQLREEHQALPIRDDPLGQLNGEPP